MNRRPNGVPNETPGETSFHKKPGAHARLRIWRTRFVFLATVLFAGTGLYYGFEGTENEEYEYLNGTLCKKEYGDIPLVRELIAKKVTDIVIQPINRDARIRGSSTRPARSAVSYKETGASSKWISSGTVDGGRMMLRMAEREGWEGRTDYDSCLYDGWKWYPVKVEPVRWNESLALTDQMNSGLGYSRFDKLPDGSLPKFWR